MKRKAPFIVSLIILPGILVLALGFLPGPLRAGADSPALEAPSAVLGTAFTFQGRLDLSGSPITDSCDFLFGLWDTLSGGTQIGSSQTVSAVSVTDGLFTTAIDFGGGAFNGEARWLSIAVRCPAGGGAYTALTPRQPLTAAPYALALPGLWTQSNSTSPNLIGGYSGNITAGGTSGATIGGGGQSGAINQTNSDFATVGGGRGNAAGGQLTAIGGGESNSASGDYATVSGGAYNLALGLDSVVGGGVNNSAAADYATIGGGQNNVVTDTHGTIGGGANNAARGIYTTVGGGQNNSALNWNATVGGGYLNLANGLMAVIGGGSSNSAIGDYATVAGGVANDALTFATTVAGGNDNQATASAATVAGGQYNAASNFYSAVGGGLSNTVSGLYSVIAGGESNVVSGQGGTVSGGTGGTVSGDYGTVGGGNGNYVTGYASAISGGEQNTSFGNYANIGGGNLNQTYGDYGTIAGGNGNTIYGSMSTIAGGTASYVDGSYSTIAGGRWNRIEADYGTIAGGGYSGPADRNYVTDDGGSIGGGGSNTAGNNNAVSTDAYYATVAGGWDNVADNTYATVGGGEANFASGAHSAVSGGLSNQAIGDRATVVGGSNNVAFGNDSLAAGCNAQAVHNGSFVWADSRTCTAFASERDYQFRIRAYGGARFDDDVGNWLDFIWTQPIDTSTGAYLSWGGTWTNASDKNLKENFAQVDAQAILNAVAALPIQTWNYRNEDESVRHLGPTAQDFSAAFGLGDSDTAIATIDADGVALVAVQGLYEQVQEQGTRIDALEKQNAELETRLAAMEAAVAGERPAANRLPVAPGWLLLGITLLGGLYVERRHQGQRPSAS